MALYYYTRWGGSKNNSCLSFCMLRAGYKQVSRMRQSRGEQSYETMLVSLARLRFFPCCSSSCVTLLELRAR